MSVCVVWLSKLCLLSPLFPPVACALKLSLQLCYFYGQVTFSIYFGVCDRSSVQQSCRYVIISYCCQFNKNIYTKLTCIFGGSYVVGSNYIILSSCTKREGLFFCPRALILLILMITLQSKNLKPWLVLFIGID